MSWVCLSLDGGEGGGQSAQVLHHAQLGQQTKAACCVPSDRQPVCLAPERAVCLKLAVQVPVLLIEPYHQLSAVPHLCDSVPCLTMPCSKFYNNSISGTYPSWITNLPKLKDL